MKALALKFCINVAFVATMCGNAFASDQQQLNLNDLKNERLILNEKIEALVSRAKPQEIPDWDPEQPTSPAVITAFPDIEAFLISENPNDLKETLHSFVTTNRNHPRLAEAYYWLGDVALNTQDYEIARTHFQQSFDLDDTSVFALPALLKLSLSYGDDGMHEKACRLLDIFKTQAHNTDSVVLLGHAEKASLRYTCSAPFPLYEREAVEKAPIR